VSLILVLVGLLQIIPIAVLHYLKTLPTWPTVNQSRKHQWLKPKGFHQHKFIWTKQKKSKYFLPLLQCKEICIDSLIKTLFVLTIILDIHVCWDVIGGCSVRCYFWMLESLLRATCTCSFILERINTLQAFPTFQQSMAMSQGQCGQKDIQ